MGFFELFIIILCYIMLLYIFVNREDVLSNVVISGCYLNKDVMI